MTGPCKIRELSATRHHLNGFEAVMGNIHRTNLQGRNFATEPVLERQLKALSGNCQ
jgi:hypothetical protein